MSAPRAKAGPARVDVCLLLEGTYPFTPGGVSAWVHDLVCGLDDLTFRIVALLPGRRVPRRCYDPPPNVAGIDVVFVRDLPPGARRVPRMSRLFAGIDPPLQAFQCGARLADLAALGAALAPLRPRLGRRILLDSRPAWDLVLRMYRARHAECSFLDYFWAWRCLHEGLFSMMLAPLPPARVYHTVSTGYAGLLAARARVETGRPALLTEHGIYTNERRVEIAMADWLHETPAATLAPDRPARNLGDFWIDTFINYSRVCYEACDPILTLFEGNQRFQVEDGAAPDRLRIVPNGVDAERYAALWRTAPPHPPTVALAGRVVPIKDVKTFIRACAQVRRTVPSLRAWILGSAAEEPGYADECVALVRHLGLEGTVVFAGQVRMEEYLPQIDVLVLTSISEAQPLVILEAGAAGVPIVATDVGACRELILGRAGESPPLGPGGAVTPLADPAATAAAVARLLGDPAWRASCSRAIQERVRREYTKTASRQAYRDLYRQLIETPAPGEEHAWPA